jgi:hypothetical protein
VQATIATAESEDDQVDSAVDAEAKAAEEIPTGEDIEAPVVEIPSLDIEADADEQQEAEQEAAKTPPVQDTETEQTKSPTELEVDKLNEEVEALMGQVRQFKLSMQGMVVNREKEKQMERDAEAKEQVAMLTKQQMQGQSTLEDAKQKLRGQVADVNAKLQALKDQDAQALKAKKKAAIKMREQVAEIMSRLESERTASDDKQKN